MILVLTPLINLGWIFRRPAVNFSCYISVMSVFVSEKEERIAKEKELGIYKEQKVRGPLITWHPRASQASSPAPVTLAAGGDAALLT